MEKPVSLPHCQNHDAVRIPKSRDTSRKKTLPAFPSSHTPAAAPQTAAMPQKNGVSITGGNMPKQSSPRKKPCRKPCKNVPRRPFAAQRQYPIQADSQKIAGIPIPPFSAFYSAYGRDKREMPLCLKTAGQTLPKYFQKPSTIPITAPIAI